MMKYIKKFPICPFRAKGTNKCSHKGCSICIYTNHLEKCGLYNDWVELRELDGYNDKMDFVSVETPVQTNLRNSHNHHPKRANHCVECNKVIRHWNKSGLCSNCYKKSIQKKNPTTKLIFQEN